MEATSSDNHAVREAACACLGELARKVDSQALSPHVPSLLEVLKKCFHDERWHVRDAACLASGTFFLNFPAECKYQVEQLYPLFLENLEFPISIVRQGAAAALSNVVRAYGTEVIPKTVEVILQGLKGLEKQKTETCKNADALGISPETVSIRCCGSVYEDWYEFLIYFFSSEIFVPTRPKCPFPTVCKGFRTMGNG